LAIALTPEIAPVSLDLHLVLQALIALTRAAVEGRIWAENRQDGVGARFCFALPTAA